LASHSQAAQRTSLPPPHKPPRTPHSPTGIHNPDAPHPPLTAVPPPGSNPLADNSPPPAQAPACTPHPHARHAVPPGPHPSRPPPLPLPCVRPWLSESHHPPEPYRLCEPLRRHTPDQPFDDRSVAGTAWHSHTSG